MEKELVEELLDNGNEAVELAEIKYPPECAEPSSNWVYHINNPEPMWCGRADTDNGQLNKPFWGLAEACCIVLGLIAFEEWSTELEEEVCNINLPDNSSQGNIPSSQGNRRFFLIELNKFFYQHANKAGRKKQFEIINKEKIESPWLWQIEPKSFVKWCKEQKDFQGRNLILRQQLSEFIDDKEWLNEYSSLTLAELLHVAKGGGSFFIDYNESDNSNDKWLWESISGKTNNPPIKEVAYLKELYKSAQYEIERDIENGNLPNSTKQQMDWGIVYRFPVVEGLQWLQSKRMELSENLQAFMRKGKKNIPNEFVIDEHSVNDIESNSQKDKKIATKERDNKIRTESAKVYNQLKKEHPNRNRTKSDVARKLLSMPICEGMTEERIMRIIKTSDYKNA